MITQYGIMEVVELVPDLVNLTPTQVMLFEELGQESGTKFKQFVIQDIDNVGKDSQIRK